MSTVTRLHEPGDISGRVAAEVRSRLARYGMTQTDLADALRLSQSQLSKRLRGVIPITLPELAAIATLGRTPWWRPETIKEWRPR